MNPDTCNHENTEPRARRDSLGRQLLQRQCLDCGSKVGTFLPRIDGVLIPEWDAALEQAGREAARVEREAASALLLEQNRALAFSDLSERYSRPDWQQKRAAVLLRDRNNCQSRLPGCAFHATHVHHLTYSHLGDEPLFDLIAVCKPCHERIHPHMVGGDR